jgi:large-conductance mechanosensitive channel
MFCTQCGSKLDEGANFCHGCGKRVSTDIPSGQADGNQKQQTDISVDNGGNYQPKSSAVHLTQYHHAKLDDPLLKLFVGEKKGDYYLGKWSKGDRSWNWAAFFLSYFWLGYRKMYKPILLIMAFFLVMNLVFALLGIDFSKVNSAIGTGVAFTFGMWGNYFYRQHASKKIKEIVEMHHNQETAVSEVKLRGGGSWKGVMVSLGIFTGYILLSMAIFFFVPAINQSSDVTEASTSLHPAAGKEDTKTNIKAEINDLIQRNKEVLENEDLGKYMSMVYKGDDSPLYDQTESMLDQLFTLYDLSYDISDIEFLSVSDRLVKVRLTQTSTLIAGENYRDNESVLIHTFKPQDGKWKFFKSEIESIDYFDEQEPAQTEQASSSSSTPATEAASDDYILPASDFRRLTESDIAPLSLEELRLARNEIYARRGYIFNSKELQDYFVKKPWYFPDASYDGTTLNEIEKYNAELIQNRERSLN